MALKLAVVFLILLNRVISEICPKQCDCDFNKGLNRARCVNQNIASVDVGVPKSVQAYSLTYNVISELDNFCFKEAGYTSLQVLDLSYNLIFWIGLHAFSGLDQLNYLDLSNNRLRFIPSDLLLDTPNVQTLDLSSNVFETLKNEPYLMHAKLQILNLNNCRIKSLPDRIFTRLPNLRKLDLSENYLVTLNTDVLKPLRRLDRIELRNDYWQCNGPFRNTENWIISHRITYEKQCKDKLPKMSEKMISAVIVEKKELDISEVWNITKNVTLPEDATTKPMTPFEKFDKDFSALQAFIIGLEVGLGIGIVATYVWLRSFCSCGQLNCTRPQTRRQRRRAQRLADTDMRTNLLWSNVMNPDLETPPSFRRQLSLPDRSPPFPAYGLRNDRDGVVQLQVDAVRLPDRSETPPPPYHECRIVM